MNWFCGSLAFRILNLLSLWALDGSYKIRGDALLAEKIKNPETNPGFFSKKYF
jgi:hypothetical protein